MARLRYDASTLYDFEYTDAGNAKALAYLYEGEIVYVHTVGWYIWKDYRWVKDESDGVMNFIQELSCHRQEAIRTAPASTKPADKVRLYRLAVRLEYTAGAKQCLEYAQSLPAFSRVVGQLDTNPDILVCPNGTLHLESGALTPPDETDLVTKASPIPYNPDAKCPRWMQFLEEVFTDEDGNPDCELMEYIQRAAGYSLTGHTRERCLFLFIGSGHNGKSTFLKVIAKVLWDYADTIPFGTLLQHGGERTGLELAGLRGARHVTAVESNKGVVLDEAKMKHLAGGEERIKCRFHRQDYFTYIPTYKVWLACNHAPTIRGQDEGIWGRIKLVPFVNSFTPERGNVDMEIDAKLEKELPGILAWLVEGSKQWYQNGLGMCDRVKLSTHQYRVKHDEFQDFLDKHVVVDPNGYATPDELCKRYNVWASFNGHSSKTPREFGLSMTDHGYHSSSARVSSQVQKVYKGIVLK